MQRFLALLLCLHCSAALTDFSRLEQGIRDYDDLNLTSALENFKAAYNACLAEAPSLQRNQKLADILFFEAAAYFFLEKNDEAQAQILLALDYDIDHIPRAQLPGTLNAYWVETKSTRKKMIEDQKFAAVIDIPREISRGNLERVFARNQQKLTLKTTGQWVLGFSAVPLGIGIGFGVAAFRARTQFQQIGSQLDPNLATTQSTWFAHSMISDVSLAVGIAMAATGMALWLNNQDTDF